MSRCTVTIVRIYSGAGLEEGDVVRIKIIEPGVRTGDARPSRVVAECELSLRDYARATLGTSEVPAKLIERKRP